MSNTQTTQPDPPNYDPAVMQAFFQMRYKSLSPKLRAQYAGTYGLPGTVIPADIRHDNCSELAKQGETVDPQIDTGILDGYTVNAQALQGGYMERPKIGEVVPFCTPPGVSSPGVPNYNDFTFSIKSSLDSADYPVNTEPDITPVLYVGARMNNDGDYNTQNSPEAAINPLTGALYVETDTVFEQGHTFTLYRNENHDYQNGYFWHIENAH